MRLRQGVWQEQDLELKQQQKLVITPQLRQAIEILQMPTQELKIKIKEELLANPVLEIEDDFKEPEEGLPEDNDQDDLEWEELFANTDYAFSKQVEGGYREKGDFEAFTPQAVSLTDYLLQQFNLLNNTPLEKKIGTYLIGCIDNRGYLAFSIKEICRWLKVQKDLVNSVLQKIQNLEPPGIGARNLQECLLLQLQSLDQPGNREPGNQVREAAMLILQEYYHELVRGDIKQIAKKSGLLPERVREAYNLILRLNPFPADCFQESGALSYLEPDLEVKEVNGEFVIISNDDRLPSLYINPYYRKMLKQTANGGELHEFIKRKIDAALWLIRSIQQRQVTIYRIMEAIIQFQMDFFKKGKKYLRPLTLQEVASRIGVHESTVSRASTGKYVQTPHGIFEIKDFFQSGVKGRGDSGDLASYSVKQIIAQLVKEEDKQQPLSDQKLADIIQEKGFNISRRTVAKYRNQMGIPSSSKRKRY